MSSKSLDTEIELLRGFINTPIGEQTDDQKKTIWDMLQKYEIEVKFPQCPICFVSDALTLYNSLMVKKKAQKDYVKPKYILKDDVNVIFMGELINSATITDERAEQWILMGFPLLFFKQYPKDNETETETEAKDVDNNG